MEDSINKFISHVVIDVLDHKGSLELIQQKRLWLISDKEKIKVSGYFDEDSLKIAVALKKPKKIWLQNLVHEYSHFCQWKEGTKVYKDSDATPGMMEYDSWLTGKAELSDEKLLNCTRALQMMELDCEKKAVAWIEKFKIPLNIKDYIKRANSYVFFYEIVRRQRKWYDTMAPYESKEVLNSVKDNWYTDEEYSSPSKKIEQAIIINCFDA